MKGRMWIIFCILSIVMIFLYIFPITSATPDMKVEDIWRGYIGPTRYWQVGYNIYNAGTTDVENANFSDTAWYYWGDWYKIEDSVINHTNFYLEALCYSESFFFNWYAPPGWHWISQWIDIYDEVPDQNPGNNYESRFWNWNDL